MKSNLEQRFQALQARLHAYGHALGVLSYDGSTVAPRMSAEGRAKTLGVLAAEEYEIRCGQETLDLIEELKENRDSLSPASLRALELFTRDLEYTASIPKDEYTAYQELIVRSDDAWHAAKENNDFASFAPYLKDVFDTTVRFARYYKPDAPVYDTLLGMYERGLTTEKADEFFAAVKKDLVPLIAEIGKLPTQPRLLAPGKYDIAKQRILSDRVMEIMGLDRARCAIGETEHPFTTNFNKNDVRITTHYHEEDLISSLYSVIHEGGHALYELGGGDEYEGTVIAGGVSMGIHESQSRLYENMIGRSLEFCNLIHPVLKELFPAEFAAVTPMDLYREVNRCEPSLIRTEADEVTYPMHIMIRYDIERMMVAGDVTVNDLPVLWADKMQEYLGIPVPDDSHGVLQDTHWSGGMIGYFPSYAIGSAYAAQLVAKMQEKVDFSGCIAAGNIAPITAWLTENIYRHSCMYDPKQLFESAAGAPFDPGYYTRYLVEKFRGVYGI